MIPRAAFERLWRRGIAATVFREILADCETPVSAFRKIDRGTHAFLLESVEGGEVWGRYSIMASDVRTVLSFRGGAARLRHGSRSTPIRGEDPLAALREVLAAMRAGADASPGDDEVPVPPPPFGGGAVGWMTYDAARHYAPVTRPKPDAGEPGLAEANFLLPDAWLVFDRLRSRIALVASTALDRLADPRASAGEVWTRATRRLAALEAQLSGTAPPEHRKRRKARRDALRVGDFDVDDATFRARVARAQEYIKAGDVIQTVLSRRREGRWNGDPFDVYRALRLVNPSPYMFHLRAGSVVLAGSSPEALVRVSGGKLTTRPIAGTRPRGATPAEDVARAEELLRDEKEKAEHLMLVDLGRNDLGRVAKIGTVKVPGFMRVERYSHVMHLVSDVTAELADGKDAFDAVASVFPAGTLSGAPKIRAMQIVSELEGRRRGAYGGMVGWFDLAGNADTCIAIRMVQMKRGKDGVRFSVQAGAGIVYDSDPAAEAAETVAKSRGVIRALELAAEGLP